MTAAPLLVALVALGLLWHRLRSDADLTRRSVWTTVALMWVAGAAVIVLVFTVTLRLVLWLARSFGGRA